MNARGKLNVIFMSGAFLFASFAGISCQSWIAFLVVLIVAILIGLGRGGIRP
jgi:hypothetical protein